jgi:hypothetical protein
MRKKILNNLNLDSFENMIQKKLMQIEFFELKREQSTEENVFEKILNDFLIPETIDEISDPKFGFNNDVLDYDYFAKRFKGFDVDGWNCIDILVQNTNKKFHKV